MPKLHKVKGSTSVILDLFIQDSSSTTGAGLTGLVFNTAGITCYYHRNTAASAVAVTLVTMTVGTFTSSGFKEVDATNMPGVYQLCLPDAAFATGADSVSAILKGAANMVPLPLEMQLTGVDFADGVRFGLTALPNVAAGANGGLPTGNASGQVVVSATAAGAIAAASFAAGAIDNAAIATDAIGSAELAASAVTEIQAGLSTLDAAGVRTAVGLAAANLDTQIAAVQADTDNIQTRIPAALVTGRMDSSVGAMATDTLTAAALATDAVTEIQTGLSTLTTAQVKTQVVDALAVDTYAEPASVPAATASIKDKLNWLFLLARNKRTTTSTTDVVRNDADSVTVATSTISDDGTTFTRGKYS